MKTLNLPGLGAAAVLSLGLALSLSACEDLATYTQPSLVRVIDASNQAPALTVDVEGAPIAANAVQGNITPYGTVTANGAAPIKVFATATGSTLMTTTASLLAGQQHSILITDNGANPATYAVTILADQQSSAPYSHSTFRFLNQALKTGAVDVYMVPAGATLANAVPIVTNVAVGVPSNYVTFASQTVNMVITPTGVTTPAYTSPPMALTGSEVRTVLILNTQLTTNPPVMAYIATDAD